MLNVSRTGDHPGRNGKRISLWPLKLDEALAALLGTKPEPINEEAELSSESTDDADSQGSEEEGGTSDG
jgi:hypothetical protein